MKRKNKGPVGVFVSILVAGSLVTGYQVGQAATGRDHDGARQKSVYLLKQDLIGMPYKIVLTKSCMPAEDTMARLRVVEYEPGQGYVKYRCLQP